MASQARAIMEGLQGEARQRNLKEAAAKEEDPIYGFIANMDAMNKQVWGYLCEQCAQEHIPSSCASLHAPPPMHIPPCTWPQVRSTIKAVGREMEEGPEVLTVKDRAGVPLASGVLSAPPRRGSVGLVGAVGGAPAPTPSWAKTRETGLGASARKEGTAAASAEALVSIKAFMDAGFGPAPLRQSTASS